MGYVTPIYPQTTAVITAIYASDETPGGAIDGINKVFTLANPPAPPTSLQLILNGVVQNYGTDYTLVGLAITMTVAPNLLDALTAFYFF